MSKDHAGSFAKAVLEATEETALTAVRGVGADEQGDLVEAWVKAGNVAAVARVAREDDAPAPARKAARRGLNVLKSRGLAVPEASAVVRPFAEKSERTLEARMIPPDGSGSSVLSIVSRAAGKETEIVDVVVVENVGVIRTSGGFLPSSKLREWEKSSRQNRGFDPVTVPVAWARFHIARHRARNAVSKVPPPLELDRFAHLLEPVPDAEPPHPVVAGGLALEPSDAAPRVQNGAGLHLEPELRSYLPTREAIGEMLAKVGEQIAPLGQDPPPDAVSKALAEEVAAATDRFFNPEIRELLGARLLDVAASILGRGGKERALDALATRKAVLEAGLITQPPRDIPFLRGFFDKAVAILAQQNGGRLSIPVPTPTGSGGPVLSADQLAAIQAARAESAQVG